MLDGRPLPERWSRRYVSGGGPNVLHLANFMPEDRKNPELRSGLRSNLIDISDRFESSEYLSPHSDIVANQVLDHQVYVWNWIARLNTECQPNVRSQKDQTDLLLAYLLLHTYQKEFDGPITGTSDFTKWYVRQAPQDSDGRSLSELDLHQRLFRYGVSPMIYSRPFQQLSHDARRRIYTFIDEMLPSRFTSAEDFAEYRSGSVPPGSSAWCQSRHHSKTFPCMSDRPQVLAG